MLVLQVRIMSTVLKLNWSRGAHCTFRRYHRDFVYHVGYTYQLFLFIGI